MKRIISVCFFVLFSASGCVTATPADVMKANFRLLADNIEALSALSHPKLHYLGVGFYPEPWSENDVVRIGDRLSTVKGYAYAPIILSNRYSSIPEDHPAANRHVMEAAISHIAEDYEEGDLVVVAISTHGTKGAVVVQEGENAKKPTILPAVRLGFLLNKLGGARAIIIVSACHSGSLIDYLQAPERVVVTAAREDRVSFGCSPGTDNSFFVQALARNMTSQHASFDVAFKAAFTDVQNEEDFWQFGPSYPQVNIGMEMRDIWEKPIF